jgi:hypothetical protein
MVSFNVGCFEGLPLTPENAWVVESKGVRHMSRTKGALKSLVPALLACGVVVILAAPKRAWAVPPPTVVDVTKCRVLLGDNVIFQVMQNITTSSKSDCLILFGSNSALDLHGYTISGPGSGPGQSSGSGIVVLGFNDLVEGLNGSVQDFKFGITDTGLSTVGDEVNLDDDGVGLRMQGQADRWTNFEASNSVSNGVLIDKCNDDCSATDFYSHNNGTNGALVLSSRRPKLDLFTTTANTVDGVHIGCSPEQAQAQVDGQTCKNSHVIVVDGFAGGPMPFGSNGGSGIVLDTSEAISRDQVSLVQATGNTVDLFDMTANCGDNPYNLWFDNLYETSEAGTTSPAACILLSITL